MVSKVRQQAQKGLQFSFCERLYQELLIVREEEKGAGTTTFAACTRLEDAFSVEFGSQRGIQEVEIAKLVQIIHEGVKAVKCYIHLGSYCKSLIFRV